MKIDELHFNVRLFEFFGPFHVVWLSHRFLLLLFVSLLIRVLMITFGIVGALFIGISVSGRVFYYIIQDSMFGFLSLYFRICVMILLF
jgi:hypothetical protein